MKNEIISSKQAISIMIMFIIGSTLVAQGSNPAKHDIYISVLLAIVVSIPFMLIYSRLLFLFPGKDLFEILDIVLGRFFGKLITLLLVWYTFHVGALVIRNFSEFVSATAMTDTPQFIIIAFLGLLCIWATKDGIELLGRWAFFVLPFVIVAITITVLLCIPKMDFKEILPILDGGTKPVMNAALSLFTFPFGETMVFTMVFYTVKNKFNVTKVYFFSLLFGGLIILIVFTKNIMVLGSEVFSITHFPSYAVARLINIGDFLQRIEGSVAITYMLAGFTKVSVLLLITVKGVAKILNFDDYKPLVAPVGILMMNFSYIIYDNIMEMIYWAETIYKYYALPFQVLIPVLLLIIAEIKVHINGSYISEKNK